MARGPAYPYINLEEAVTFARKVYEYAKRSPAPLVAVVRDKWDYSPTSSSTVKVIAALRYFGLIEVSGSSDAETIKITDRAYRILLDSEDSPERKKALRDACLAAKAYKLCWDTWGIDMPASMRSSLIFEHGFVESTVDAFLANYRKSVQFAGLMEQADDDHTDPDDASGERHAQSAAPAVQSSSGQGQAASAKLPVGVPGSIAHPPTTAVAPQPVKGAGMKQEVFVLAEGDIVIQWPERMSQDSFQDVTDWLRILERKIKRSVIPTAGQSEPPQDQEPK